ncbi:MAG: hypothetical protein H6Q86_5169 [candidate division NC10 bacterium]|nr:hypothetical protein [candidate division NC10 bacterium]
MRRFTWFTFALLLIVGAAAPSDATVATIATTAPLKDHQEQSVNAALRAAVQTAVAGAAAMGLPWVQISRALVLDDAVAVQILATDEDPEADAGKDAPDPENESDADSLAPTARSL